MSGDWFYETSDLWPGQAFGLKIKREIYSGRTKFQDVRVFESETYGNVLVLDGVIQVTDRDEFAYQEMISQIPLMCHPDPKRVLIIGGGDGGCVREALKHPGVEQVELVEIDETVIDLSRKYLPQLSCALDDARVKIHITDGFDFLRQSEAVYDVIISDTSDPEGPAEKLFEKGYFELLKSVLRPHGVCALQASENVWLKIDVLRQLQQTCRSVFPIANYATVAMPTYTSGQLGLMICSNDAELDVRKPVRENAPSDLKYYNPAIHTASFVLPQMAKQYIDDSIGCA